MGKDKPITVPGGTILKVGRGKWLACRWGQAVQHPATSRENAIKFLASKQDRETKMPVKVKTKVKSATAAKAKPKAKPASKRERATHDNDALRAQVAKRLGKGEAISDIADALHITAGKAAYLNMLNIVEETPRLRIKGRNEDEIAANIVKARNAEDEHSAWGWISARAGLPESKVKALAEAAGVKVKGSHVAKARAAAAEKPVKKATKAKSKKAADPSK